MYLQLNDDLMPNYSFLENSLLEMPISHDLYEELVSGQQYCRQAANCQPRRSQLHELPITSEFSSSLEFLRCFGKEKLRACMKADALAMAEILSPERGPIHHDLSSVIQDSDSLSTELEDLLNGGEGRFINMVLL